ncbi:MAG: Fructose-1,6-bisphosphate aldolase, class II, partial [Candidatus Woesebacteria bacterium GW2011_GWA1_39_8]
MLTNSKQMIIDAQAGKYAIGSFNTSDMEITKAIIAAAEALKSPVIISTSEKAIEYAGLETIAAIISKEAQKATVPVALHLDHGKTITMVEKCLQAGY